MTSTADHAGVIADVLATHRFFQDLPEALTERLARCAERVAYDTDIAILTEGSRADRFWAIETGRVAVGVRTPNRGLVVIETLEKGDILGWSWLFPPHRWTFDAVTRRPVTAVEFHSECILPYLDEDPKAAYRLLQGVAGVMEERLQSARMRLIDVYGTDDVRD